MQKIMRPGELFEKNRAKMMKRHKLSNLAPGQAYGTNLRVPKGMPAPTPKQLGWKQSPLAKGTLKMVDKLQYKKQKSAKKGKKHKNWIAGAIKHPGALHRELGVKEGKKIPAKTLAKAAKKGGKIGRRARLAETLKGLHHKKHKGKKWTQAQDDSYDKKHGIKEGSKRDIAQDKAHGIKDKKRKGMRCKKHNKMRCKHCK